MKIFKSKRLIFIILMIFYVLNSLNADCPDHPGWIYSCAPYHTDDEEEEEDGGTCPAHGVYTESSCPKDPPHTIPPEGGNCQVHGEYTSGTNCPDPGPHTNVAVAEAAAEAAAIAAAAAEQELLDALASGSPTEQEAARQALEDAQAAQQSSEDDLRIAEVTAEENKKENEENSSEITGETGAQEGETGGDPVLLASGSFVTSETDMFLSLSGKSLVLSRHFNSSRTSSHSLGFGWSSSLDSRVIIGVDHNIKEYSVDLRARATKAADKESVLIAQQISKAAWIGPVYNDAVSAKNLAQTAYNSAVRSVSKANKTNNSSLRSEAQTQLTTATGILSSATSHLNSIDVLKNQIEIDMVAEIALLTTYKEELGELADQAEKENEVSLLGYARNQYSINSTDKLSLSGTGIDTITYIDEAGTPHLYHIDTLPEYGSKLLYDNGLVNYWPNGSSTTALYPTDTELFIESDGGYSISEKNGTVSKYNFFGIIESKTYRDGKSITFIHDDLIQIVSIKDNFNRSISISWIDMKISSMEDSEGNTTSFEYNHDNRLALVSDLDNDIVQYTYYPTGEIEEIIKPDESFRRYNYITQDGKRFVSSTVDEEGDTEYFFYHPDNNFTRYIDPSGVEVFHYYDDRKRETKVVYPDYSYTEKTYDENNNIKTSRSRSGNTTTFTYDDKWNITEIYHQDGSFETREYNEFSQLTELNDSDGNRIINDYDDKGNLISTKVFDDRGSLESEESYIYNEKGLVTSRSRGNTYDGLMITEDFTYDEYGSISTVTDGENNIWVYDYDSIGKLLSVTDPDENTTSYEYTPSGRISKIVYPDETFEQTFYTNRKDIDYVVDREGNTFDYTYNKKHNLLSVENPLNQSVVYTYNPTGKVESKSVFSENGDLEAFSEYIYDSNTGDLITERKQIDESESATTSYDYFNGLLWKITDPEGTITEYLYNNREKVQTKVVDHVDLELPVKEYFEYTGRGQLEVYTDPRGYETEYDYSAMGQISQVLNPDNTIKEYDYDGLGRLISSTDEEDYTTQFRYDDTGKRSAVIYSDGTSEKWTYNDTGFIKTYTDRNESTFEYEVDLFGQILEVKLPYPYEGLSEKYTYNSRGQILTSEDPNGNVWTREYDKLGNLISTIDPENKETINEYTPLGQLFRTTTADSAQWEREFDMAGRLIGSLDPLHNRTSYGYDNKGQLLFEEDPLSRTKYYKYNPLGQLTSTRDGENVGVDYAYDPSGNLIVETQTGGEPYNYIYDKRNRLEKEINRLGDIKTYTYYKNNKVHRITDFNGDVTTFSYDEADRLSRKEFSVGGFESFTYDGAGNLLLTENNASRLEYAYDPLGRMVKSIDHYKDEEISYDYDPSGNRIALSWADEDRRATWAYDNLNRPISMIDPEGNETNFSYDLMGREIERDLPNGISINTTYDIAGRVTSISHNEGNRYRHLPARFYSYNDAGQVTLQMDEKGRTSSWEYDNAGRLSKASYAFAGGKSVNDFWERTYLGITEKEIKDGYESYQDSHFSFIENLFRNNGFYDDFGVSEDDYRDDLNEAYSELSGVFPELEKSSASAFIRPYGNFSYKRNWGHLKKGLPKEVNKWFNSWSLMRFLFQPQWTEEFSYDSKGNITNKSNGWGDVPYTYNDENQMITAGERQYEYDKNGNLSREWLEDRSANYKYDGENRLIELTSNTPGFIGTPGHLMDKGLMYTYDSIGRRTSYQQIEKLEGEDFRDRFDSTGTRMSYLYDGLSFNVLAEGMDSIGQTSMNRWSGNSDRSFNPTSEYLYTNGKAVVRTDVTTEHHSFLNRHGGWQHSKNYYTQDNLGSIIGIMDSHGHIDEKYTYDAFGKLVEGRFDYVNKLGYNGKMYDNYSGLVNYGFRDYSPVAMRFTTVDPVKSGSNWYAYVTNDPINLIDPYGLTPSDKEFGMGGGPVSGQTWNGPYGTIEGYGVGLSQERKDELSRMAGVSIQWKGVELNVPTTGVITSNYKDPNYIRRPDGSLIPHRGVDLGNVTGTPIYAAADGKVLEIYNDPKVSYGYGVRLEHEGGIETIYGHMDKLPLVKFNQKVKQDEQLGVIGNTGNSDGPHLHYEVRVDGVVVDPSIQTPGLKSVEGYQQYD